MRTVAEAAAELRLHPVTVYRKVAAGELPSIRTGGSGSAVRCPAHYLEQLAQATWRSPRIEQPVK